MASVVDSRSIEVLEKRDRVNWGALIAGTVLTLGIWMLLMVLGVALGLTAIRPGEQSIQGESLFTGIWALVSPLIALFFGAWATARLARTHARWSGVLHGAVVWALSSLLGFWVLANTIGAAVSGIVNVGGQAISATAQGASGLSLQQLGIDTNDLLGPVNERLRAEGKPEVTGAQLEAATKDALGTAVREGRFDRQLIVTSIAQNTNLSQQDAQEVAASIESRWNEQRGQVGGVIENAQQQALAAADAAGKALWWVFGMMFLGLISAILGGMTGTTHERIEQVPLATRREVHP